MKIEHDQYIRKIKAACASNVASVVGGSTGAAIGCFVGNIVAPGIGGYVGSMLGGFLLATISSIGADYLIDPSSYSIENYEEMEVDEKEKYQAYLRACETIQVPPSATKETVKFEMNSQYKRFHPDKHATDSP